ncbi:hypothetical protein PGB90_001938 [Kerria lacca]
MTIERFNMDYRQLLLTLEFFTFLSLIVAQTTLPPVRILKQINRQNEDGSYSYGYENDDGSYKIETKSAAGEIVGKYGYIDVDGKLREIEYGASKRGFEPVGTGITVPPPTIHVQNGNNLEQDYDDGQYREDPSIYYKNEKSNVKPESLPNGQPSQSNFKYEASLQSAPSQYNWYQQPQNAAPYNADPSLFRGHPAANFDPYSGSYTINYFG